MGVWLSLVDELRGVLPEELLARVQPGGYSQDELHALLDGTRFRALPVFADYLRGETGNMLLDVGWESLGENYGNMPAWTEEEVQGFTDEWRGAKATLDATNELGQSLEEDPEPRLRELLDFIDVRKGVQPLPGQTALPLVEVFRPEGGETDGG